MLIAIDYDDTYDRDPVMWMEFIKIAKQHGHAVVCATMRYENEQTTMCYDLRGAVRVICTGRAAKRPFLEGLGLKPDVWIDDSPHWILSNAF